MRQRYLGHVPEVPLPAGADAPCLRFMMRLTDTSGRALRMSRFTLVGLATMTALTVTATGCASGSSSRATKPLTSSTTHRRKPFRSTSTTSAPSTSTTTAAPSSSTAPPPPSASNPPPSDICGARSGPIYAAVQGGDLGPVPLGDYEITECRIAASNQIWAAVTLKPLPGKAVVPLTVALLRIGSIWTVKQYAQTHVACDAPPPVPTELRLGC